jgi:methionyl-tRNA formyltransferase
VRVVFFGTPDMAVPSLEAVADRHDVVAVVCQPDKPAGRKNKLHPPPVKVCAERLGIPVHQPSKLNDGTFEVWLKEQKPEVCVLVAYGRILKVPILEIPPKGFLNVHPSLLPLYRGPAPIYAAILNGDTETGITIMELDEGMDSGDMLLQEPFPIADDDTTGSLTLAVSTKGAEMLLEALEQVEAGTLTRTPQDHTQATYCDIIMKEDGRINWHDSATQIVNQVRACQPWPVAYATMGDHTYRVHNARACAGISDDAPGTILETEGGGLTVQSGDGAVEIIEIQAPGKRALPTADFLRGNALPAGTRFEVE